MYINDAVPEVYGEVDRVPVRVLGGECTVSFKSIFERVRRLAASCDGSYEDDQEEI